MTQRWYVRTALSVLVGVGLAASLARAQPPAPQPAPSPEPWAVIEFGAGSSAGPAPVVGAPGAPRRSVVDWIHSRPRPVVDVVHDCMHNHGVGCWSHHNAYLCGSWQSECTFIFGSCREFFGEPCRAGPPPPPYVPPGYPPPPGYGPAVGYGTAPRKGGCPSCQ
jgi:hypothetical protein